MLRFLFASLVRAVLTMATIWLMQQFLAGVLGGQQGLAHRLAREWGQIPSLWIVAGLLATGYLLISAATYDSHLSEQRLIRALELEVMDRLTAHLLTLSVDFFDRHSHGDLVHALRQDVIRLRNVLAAEARIILEAAQAAGLIAAAAWMSPKLALVSLVGLPLAAAPVLRMARRTRQRSFNVRQGASLMYDVILQVLRGIRVIKVYRAERREAERASQHAQHFFQASIAMTSMEAFSKVLVESVAGLSVVVVVVVGGFDVMSGTLGWPSLLAFLVALRGVHGPLNNLNTQYLEAHRYGASLERIDKLFRERPVIAKPEHPAPWPAGLEEIRFDGVSFGYGGKTVLESISFRVRAGETIGIVGPSGAGKTTLLSLMARFCDPVSGRISVNGVDLRDYSPDDVCQAVALVPQEPFLFAASARENILLGRPEATTAELERAAQAAEIHHAIAGWPEGYDTVIGLAGRGVSEGQSQRINIARALLKNAPILLLDEATSSLDSIAEATVQRAIDSLVAGRTTFVVAHRLSTLRNADQILVLDHGRMAGFGTHAELMESCPLYATMWRPQASLEPLEGVQ